MEYLDSAPGLVEKLAAEGMFQNGGWRILKRGETVYQADRISYDCLAVRSIAKNRAPNK